MNNVFFYGSHVLPGMTLLKNMIILGKWTFNFEYRHSIFSRGSMVYYFLILILITLHFKQVFPHVNYAVLEKLQTVDCIIYAMGSLFTSICPSLVTSWTSALVMHDFTQLCMTNLGGLLLFPILLGLFDLAISVYSGLLLVALSMSEENQSFTTIMYLEYFSSDNCSTLKFTDPVFCLIFCRPLPTLR